MYVCKYLASTYLSVHEGRVWHTGGRGLRGAGNEGGGRGSRSRSQREDIQNDSRGPIEAPRQTDVYMDRYQVTVYLSIENMQQVHKIGR